MAKARCGVAWLAWSVAMLGGTIASAEPQLEPGSEVAKRKALETFREGIEAFDRHEYDAARVAFLQTLALRPGEPVVRRNLGLAEIYGGYHLAGARRLSRVLHTTDEGDAPARARMRESLEIAEAHLERLTLEVDVEGADISVDDERLGASPLPFAWYVAPGRYEVRVERDGFEVHEEQHVARAGEHRHLRIALSELASTAAPAFAPRVSTPGSAEPVPLPTRAAPVSSVPAAPVEPRSSGNAALWLGVGGGVAVTGAIVGLVLSAQAAGSDDEAARLRRELGGTGCGTLLSPPVTCGALSGAVRRRDKQRLGAWVSFGVGGVVGLATLAYAWVVVSGDEPKASDPATDLAWGVVPTPRGARLRVSGRF